ncbi:DNA-methyltransferase [Nonomuraea typhae]|uniref:Methyltransferase n=1 Tax=Nonomuraea typhae TaxID=2603600 RepID=A0ABW7YLS6_9ACTN
MRDGQAIVIRGDARNLPLPDKSVDLVCTSPPYFGLRDYRDGDASLAGQIGNEPTPWEYLESLWVCTREWMRVLKPEGSLWINLGDKYAQNAERSRNGQGARRTTRSGGLTGTPGYLAETTVELGRRDNGVPLKSLIGLPWLYAAGCTGALARVGGHDPHLDLILRAEIVWSKPSAMPESVTDRVRRTHEQIFHFTKQPQYYSAVDEIRLPASDYERKPGARRTTPPGQRRRAMADTVNPLGALPGSVWEIASQPLLVPDHLQADHYAAYPFEIPRRIIRGWSPPGICTACGEGRRPVSSRHAEQAPSSIQGARDRVAATGGAISGGTERSTLRGTATRVVTGYACACRNPDAPTAPAVVLDPFGGSGTTALVASVLGRTGISVDRSADYCRIAAWRTTDPGERARAMGVPKPEPVHPQQSSLFDEEVSRA